MAKSTADNRGANPQFQEEIFSHPCFSVQASTSVGRIHLPVAPKCNVQCNFCNRKYDCVAESRPGVTSNILTPEEAFARLEFVLQSHPEITVVGIAGPGDPLANLNHTLKTMKIIHSTYPELKLCLSTNGLDLEKHVQKLKEAGLSHITITINSFIPETVEKIYSWVNDDDRKITGADAADLLISRQKAALSALEGSNIPVKINIVLIPGINENDIYSLVDELKEYTSVACVNIVPLIPVPGSKFESIKAPSKETLKKYRSELEPKIPQIRHCCQCRADAVGFVECGSSGRNKKIFEDINKFEKELPLKSTEIKEEIKVAAVSSDGEYLNDHFGHATKFYIYQLFEDGFEQTELRKLSPLCCSDESDSKEIFTELMQALSDCTIILCSQIGPHLQSTLENAGFKIVKEEGKIEEALDLMKL